MFGNSSNPSRIYSYAAQAPRRNYDKVCEQMWLAHQFRNKLVESELERRAASNEVLSEVAEHLEPIVCRVATLQEDLEASEDLLKRIHASERSRSAGREASAGVKELRSILSESRHILRCERRAAWEQPGVRARLPAIESEHEARGKRHYAETELYWGTKLHVMQSCMTFKKGAPPQFQRWHGDGHLAVQIQRGMTWEEALSGTDSRIRVSAGSRPDDGKRANHRQQPVPGSKRSQRRQHLVVSFRIGSEGQIPIFAEVPIVLHRPLPAGCSIKWVHLIRRRFGHDDKWQLQFVVSREEGFPHEDQAATGCVKIGIGWSMCPAGLRVAHWVGDDGMTGEVVIPSKDMERWNRVKSLQGTRDEEFSKHRALLANWKTKHHGLIPQWMQEKLKEKEDSQKATHLMQWRNPARLTSLLWFWKDHRFDGDEDIFKTLEAWRLHELHLHRFQIGVLRQAQEFREHLYRNAVVALRRRYHTAKIPPMDIKKLTLKEKVEDPKAPKPYHRQLASPGRFVELLREHMGEVFPNRKSARKTEEDSRE